MIALERACSSKSLRSGTEKAGLILVVVVFFLGRKERGAGTFFKLFGELRIHSPKVPTRITSPRVQQDVFATFMQMKTSLRDPNCCGLGRFSGSTTRRHSIRDTAPLLLLQVLIHVGRGRARLGEGAAEPQLWSWTGASTGPEAHRQSRSHTE